MTKILVCETVIVPDYVLVGSKSDDALVHKVLRETIYNDPICDCRGYLFRGRCSHIDQIQETKCFWWTDEVEYTGPCPNCSSRLIEFEV